VQRPPSDYPRPTSFDSPAARSERLDVITGGEQLREFFRIRKVVLTKRNAQLWWIVDVRFTDAGLVVVPYAQVQQQTNVGGGLVGFAIAAASNAMAKSSASRKYDSTAHQDFDTPPDVLFIERKDAELLPADELDDILFTRDRKMQVTFRGLKYTFAPHDSADYDMLGDWSHAYQYMEDWQRDSAQDVETRQGGPPEPGPVALVEWAQRPYRPPPPWVGELLEAMVAGGEDPATMRLLRTAPAQGLGALSYRLEADSTPAGEVVGQWVKTAGLGASKILLWIMWVCLGLLLIPLVVFFVGVNMDSGKSHSGDTAGAMIGMSCMGSIALGVLALVFMAVGLSRYVPYHRGRKQARLRASR
jgi:hypothetical protein